MVVRPGGSVPADGEIVDGAADDRRVDGHRRIRAGAPRRGRPVVAGTVATDSGLRVKVTAVGDDTALAGIQRLVTEAQNSSSRAQRLADKAAGWLFWFALGAARRHRRRRGACSGSPTRPSIRTITVLVIACPHALGLAIPLVVSIATERAARGGVLIKDRLALESMRTVGAVLFDKTGTLTKGEPTVTARRRRGSRPRTRCWRWRPPPRSDSEHPLAKAIVAAAQPRELTVPASSDFSSSPAVGVTRGSTAAGSGSVGPACSRRRAARSCPRRRPWRDEGAIVLHVLVDGRRGRRAGAGRRGARGVPAGRRRAAQARHPGGDDHRRR